MTRLSARELEAAVRRNPSLRIVADGGRRTGSGDCLTMEFPLELPTENRLRAMRSVYQRARIVKAQRKAVALAFLAWARGFSPSFPVDVTLVRIDRKMDGHDSLGGAFKAVVDEVTEQLGLTNDADPRLHWIFLQERRGSRPKSIRIVIRPREVGK